MKNFFFVVLIIGFFAFFISVDQYQYSHQRNRIVKWCSQRHESVEMIERTIFSSGPYWRQKSDHIFHAKTENERGNENEYWFCFRSFRSPTAQIHNADGSYTELEFDE